MTIDLYTIHLLNKEIYYSALAECKASKVQ